MLKKVLIANRSEIAVRIMRTCRELGVPTVAVYSDPDRDAMHVRFADEAYPLPGRTAAETYLNGEAIAGLLDRSGADGLHPGYGFLAENAAFARSVAGRDVTFIGPPASAIETMGDKIMARRAAEAAGVPVLPGSGALSSAADLIEFGETRGWPVAVKAAFGGGGRGMRVITGAADAPSALESAEREARAYFGRPELYAERFLTRPRHIEMQVLADAHGHVVWLGERDCSAQRRHQKLVEECPAPAFPGEVRCAMGEASVRLARACGYTGVGTVEFLYADGAFYFLEMNTRLQVEHPVTELVTGLDLVEWQLRVASGEALSFGQADITVTGHAIEARVNAEDPAGGRFLPSPGALTAFTPPAGPGIRVDAGYAAGDSVSPHYDNLVAKLVAWAPDRDRARHRLLRALRETEIQGIATTIPAQVTILEHPDFIAAGHSTNWIDTELDLSLVHSDTGRPAPGRTATAPAIMNGGRPASPAWRTRRGVPPVSTWSPGNAAGRTQAQGAIAGHGPLPSREAREAREARGAGEAHGSPGRILAPVQGAIVKVLVGVGDQVLEDEVICVIEAMKMENVVHAGLAGSVAEVRVAPGACVDAGAVIAVIRP